MTDLATGLTLLFGTVLLFGLMGFLGSRLDKPTATDRYREERTRRADEMVDLGFSPEVAYQRATGEMQKEAEEALKL